MRAASAGAALAGLVAFALVPALLLDRTGYDTLFYEDRTWMRQLAWLALAVPLASAPLAWWLGWDLRAADAAERVTRRFAAWGRGRRALLVAGFGAAGLAVGAFVLLGFANSADEYAYTFQAHTYARGEAWLDPHPLDAHVFFMHGKVIDGKWLSRFPPGWPLALAPFVGLGLPAWSLNAAVSAAVLALVFVFGRRELGTRAALAGAAVFGVSGFALLNAGATYSHPFGALLSLLFAWAAVRYLERPTWALAALAGLALGWLGLARQMNAALLAPPFLLALLARRSWAHVGRAWPLAAVAGAFLALLLAYNHAVTGDPFVLPTTVDDPKQTLGFVGEHTPQRAYKFIQARLLLLPRYTSGLFLFLYGVALLRGALRRDLRWWDAYFVLELLGYSLYQNSAHNTYGPRYLFEAFPFAALRIGALCAPAAAARGAAEPAPAPGGWRPLATWLLGVHLASAAASAVGAGWMWAQIIRERRDPVRAVEEAGLRDAVVFVASDTSPRRRMPRFDLVRNTPDVDAQPVVWAHWRGGRVDPVLAYYPGRSFWVYTRPPDAARGRLVPLEDYRARRGERG